MYYWRPKQIPDAVLDLNERAGAAVLRWQKAKTKEAREAAEAEARALIAEGEAIDRRPYWTRWYVDACGERTVFGRVDNVGKRGGVYGRTYYRTRPPSKPHTVRW